MGHPRNNYIRIVFSLAFPIAFFVECVLLAMVEGVCWHGCKLLLCVRARWNNFLQGAIFLRGSRLPRQGQAGRTYIATPLASTPFGLPPYNNWRAAAGQASPGFRASALFSLTLRARTTVRISSCFLSKSAKLLFLFLWTFLLLLDDLWTLHCIVSISAFDW